MSRYIPKKQLVNIRKISAYDYLLTIIQIYLSIFQKMFIVQRNMIHFIFLHVAGVGGLRELKGFLL